MVFIEKVKEIDCYRGILDLHSEKELFTEIFDQRSPSQLQTRDEHLQIPNPIIADKNTQNCEDQFKVDFFTVYRLIGRLSH